MVAPGNVITTDEASLREREKKRARRRNFASTTATANHKRAGEGSLIWPGVKGALRRAQGGRQKRVDRLIGDSRHRRKCESGGCMVGKVPRHDDGPAPMGRDTRNTPNRKRRRIWPEGSQESAETIKSHDRRRRRNKGPHRAAGQARAEHIHKSAIKRPSLRVLLWKLRIRSWLI